MAVPKTFQIKNLLALKIKKRLYTTYTTYSYNHIYLQLIIILFTWNSTVSLTNITPSFTPTFSMIWNRGYKRWRQRIFYGRPLRLKKFQLLSLVDFIMENKDIFE